MTSLADRVRGCIIGGAVGDAMGGPFEGHRGPVRFREPARWSVSDDSQLTLATYESIIEARNVHRTMSPHAFFNGTEPDEFQVWVQVL